MKRTAQILTLLAVSIASMLLAFFVCANFNYNPFGGVHGEGSSDTVYVPKTVTVEIPSVTAPVLHGKPLTKTQQLSLNRSRLISGIDIKKDTAHSGSTKSYNEPFPIDSICPPFGIDTSLRWNTAERITLPDTSFTARDSGVYKFGFIVDPANQRVIDFTFDGTPLHPVIVEKQITNTITIRKAWRLGLYAEWDAIQKGFSVGLRGSINLGALSLYASPNYDGKDLHAPLGAEGLLFEH